MRITSVAIAIAALIHPELVDARKRLIGADGERLHSRTGPTVTTDTCEDRCLFGKDNEDKEYWCFQFKEPVLKLGWEYK